MREFSFEALYHVLTPEQRKLYDKKLQEIKPKKRIWIRRLIVATILGVLLMVVLMPFMQDWCIVPITQAVYTFTFICFLLAFALCWVWVEIG